MLLAKGHRWRAVLVSVFFIASAAHSAVTVSDSDRMFVTYPASVVSDAVESSVFNFSQIAELQNPQVKTVAERFLSPSLSSSYSPQAADLKFLPAVPGTIFMVLTGFVCVSLVKDRKLWLAALAGLLWLSQTSVTALPKLASHLYSEKYIERFARNLTSSFRSDNSSRFLCGVQGEYIGLLRRLAGIPNNIMISLPSHNVLLRLKLQQQRDTQYAVLNTHDAIRTTRCVMPSTQNSKLKTQNSKHNTQLPRGPPSLT
jgi:hypothetical protein